MSVLFWITLTLLLWLAALYFAVVHTARYTLVYYAVINAHIAVRDILDLIFRHLKRVPRGFLVQARKWQCQVPNFHRQTPTPRARAGCNNEAPVHYLALDTHSAAVRVATSRWIQFRRPSRRARHPGINANENAVRRGSGKRDFCAPRFAGPETAGNNRKRGLTRRTRARASVFVHFGFASLCIGWLSDPRAPFCSPGRAAFFSLFLLHSSCFS